MDKYKSISLLSLCDLRHSIQWIFGYLAIATHFSPTKWITIVWLPLGVLHAIGFQIVCVCVWSCANLNTRKYRVIWLNDVEWSTFTKGHLISQQFAITIARSHLNMSLKLAGRFPGETDFVQIFLCRLLICHDEMAYT